MELTVLNGNGASAVNTDAVINGNARNNAIVRDADQMVKRKRRNTIRRIRRVIRKDGMDLHYYDGQYFQVPVRHYAAIDIERYGRKIGAIIPIGICDFCHRGEAWQSVENVPVCDNCAAEVRR